MPPVVRGQEDAVRCVVRRDDDAADVEHGVLADVFLIDPQHIGWCGGVGFHVIVEGETVLSAEITSFADPQDHRFDVSTEAAEHVLG